MEWESLFKELSQGVCTMIYNASESETLDEMDSFQGRYKWIKSTEERRGNCRWMSSPGRNSQSCKQAKSTHPKESMLIICYGWVLLSI